MVVSAILSVGWTLFFGGGNYDKLAPLFFMVVAASWSVLIPSKLWLPSNDEDSWTRRLLLMTLGFVVGLMALWLDGYELPMPWTAPGKLEVLQPWQAAPNDGRGRAVGFISKLYGQENTSMPILACYLSYFGLMFLVLRWWKMTETYRPKRFSVKPVIAVAFWAYLLLFLLPSFQHREIGFVSLVMASVVCQVTCPWKVKVPVRSKKKMRLAMA